MMVRHLISLAGQSACRVIGLWLVYVFDYDGMQWQQTIKLVSQDSSVRRLGWSLSQFNTRVIAGATSDTSLLSGHGVIFQLDNGKWSEEAVLEFSDGNNPDPMFGWSVDLAGQLAVVSSVTGSGKAQIHRLNNGIWEYDSDLTTQGGQSGDQFGYAVGITDEFNSHVLIGNIGDDDVVEDAGSISVFENFQAGFFEVRKMTAYNWSRLDEYGSSVSISGNRALVGAPKDNDLGFDSGSAYIYDLIGGEWQLTAKLLAQDGESSDLFGSAVSLSGDRALVGALNEDDVENNSGAVYVYEWNGQEWLQTARLKATDARSQARFGNAVSLCGDRALIGAYRDSEVGSNGGAVYVFDLDNNIWTETVKLHAATTGFNDYFGGAVSLDRDRALVGAFWDATHGTDAGSAYVFTLDQGVWSEDAQLVPVDIAAGDEFGGSVDIKGDRLVVGAAEEGIFGDSWGAAYVFEFDGLDWQEAGKLVPDNGVHQDYFGCSVSLGNDWVVVGSCENNQNGTDSGAAYIYSWDKVGLELIDQISGDDTGRNDFFGSAVSADGNQFVVGAEGHNGHADNSGSAYFFRVESDLIHRGSFD
jgi:hypothetical protein